MPWMQPWCGARKVSLASQVCVGKQQRGGTSLLQSSHALLCIGLALLLAMPEVLHEGRNVQAFVVRANLPRQQSMSCSANRGSPARVRHGDVCSCWWKSLRTTFHAALSWLHMRRLQTLNARNFASTIVNLSCWVERTKSGQPSRSNQGGGSSASWREGGSVGIPCLAWALGSDASPCMY